MSEYECDRGDDLISDEDYLSENRDLINFYRFSFVKPEEKMEEKYVVYVCMCFHICIHVYVCMHEHILYIYIYIYVYIYICVYKYIYICIYI